MKRPIPPRYGRSPWIDQFPKSRIPSYPSYGGAAERDVVVIGGGLTGCAAAYAFASAGVNVTLLEAARVGQGRTADGPGWMSAEPDVDFVILEKTIGLRHARHAFQAWRRAALEGAALLRRLDVKCALEPRDTLAIARDGEQAARLTREHKARRAAGLEAALLNARAASAAAAPGAAAALRVRDGATLDPYRACLGLAAAAAARGVRVFEQSGVRRITFTRKHVDVFTAAGAIRTRAVVVATGIPTPLFRALIRHFWFRTAWLALTGPMPARVRRAIGARAAVVRDGASPPHLVRWVGDQRLLVSGAETQSGPPRLRSRAIVQQSMELMYELSTIYPEISGIQPTHGWDTEFAKTDDGLPYFGRHRNFPMHLFAFGGDSRSVTGSFLASRMLLREFLGAPEPADAPFEFARHGR
ncbi:MAG: FAD-binding oxidoreductase [Acidobacteria bacterium]|nr:FAD-binding oxidoreductase [Acidobacteriota bacterium]